MSLYSSSYFLLAPFINTTIEDRKFEVDIDENANVSTIAEISTGEFIYQAVVTTDKKGRTQTKFIKINKETGEEINIAHTLRGDMIFEIGSEIEIFELNGTIYIKIKTPLNDDLVIE